MAAQISIFYISVTIATPIMLPTKAIELHAKDSILPAFSRREESTLLEKSGLLRIRELGVPLTIK